MTRLAESDRAHPPADRSGLRERLLDPTGSLSVVAVVGVSVFLLLILLSGRLADPPFWDASWSTSVGAAELARNGFDYRELLSAPGFLEGGPGTHAASLMTPVQGLLFVAFGPSGGLIAGHLLLIAMGGGLVGATFCLARRYLPMGVSLMVAAVVVVLPVILQQVADPYIEIPLALFTVLTVMAVLDRNRQRAVLFAAFAIWLKATGLMLVPLLGLMGERGESRRWLKNGIAALVATAPFVLRLMSPSNLLARDADSTLEGTILLVRSAVMMLGSTVDLLLIFALFVLASLRLRDARPNLIRVVTIVTGGFFAIVGYTIVATQGVSVLPRYYVALLPLWLVVMTVHLREAHSKRMAVGVLSLLVLFSVVNWDGRFYPLADHVHPVMAERSAGGAQEYLELEVAGTRALAELSDSVDALIVGREMWSRFQYPELGYVSESPKNIIRVSEADDLPDEFAWLDEPHQGGYEEQLLETVEQDGWFVEVTPITVGRWTSDLIIARRP